MDKYGHKIYYLFAKCPLIPVVWVNMREINDTHIFIVSCFMQPYNIIVKSSPQQSIQTIQQTWQCANQLAQLQ